MMELNQITLEELIRMLNPEKDWLDVLSDLSTLILSITALSITTIISLKQWYLAKYEYRYKLYIERYDIFKVFDEVQNKLKVHSIVDENKLLEIENRLFLFDNVSIKNDYDQLKSLILYTDKTNAQYDDVVYKNKIEQYLNSTILEMQKYLSNFYKNKY
jgi:hypothetical protein